VRLRRQLPRQRKHKVGVYFGTFDPIHENHVGLAKFAPGCLAKPEEVPDVC
jgi:nicotinamide mononucleotide adenylyltransferase